MRCIPYFRDMWLFGSGALASGVISKVTTLLVSYIPQVRCLLSLLTRCPDPPSRVFGSAFLGHWGLRDQDLGFWGLGLRG